MCIECGDGIHCGEYTCPHCKKIIYVCGFCRQVWDSKLGGWNEK